MTPHAAKYAPSEYLELLGRINFAVSRLPDLDLGQDRRGKPIVLSCHMLTRAIGKIFGLTVVDGYFNRGFSHSWLLTKDQCWLFDVYPVGIIGGPFLVDASSVLSPGRIVYQRHGRMCKILPFSSPEFRRSVRRITKEIRKILEE